MKLMKKELGTVIMCVGGVGAVAYGTINRHNAIFILGLVLIVVGYLFIRKELKYP